MAELCEAVGDSCTALVVTADLSSLRCNRNWSEFYYRLNLYRRYELRLLRMDISQMYVAYCPAVQNLRCIQH
jgi:hypothetical protein